MRRIAFILALLLGTSVAWAQPITINPSVTSAAGASSLIITAAPGSKLFSVYATSYTATAGFLMVLNSATVPADGTLASGLVLDCVPLQASGNTSINYTPLSKLFPAGIVAVVSSGSTCATKTTGVITAFISGSAQ